MSLITAKRASPDSPTSVRYSRCSGLSGVLSTSSVMPMIAFIGVRISWLMLARKALLARLADSAAALARSSSSREAVIALRFAAIWSNERASWPISSFDSVASRWSRSPAPTIFVPSCSRRMGHSTTREANSAPNHKLTTKVAAENASRALAPNRCVCSTSAAVASRCACRLTMVFSRVSVTRSA